MENVIKRIEKMERIFDALLTVSDESPERLYTDTEILELIRALKVYYEGGQWLKDYALDEKGLIPKSVKRGVLSEDGVYNLLMRIDKR